MELTKVKYEGNKTYMFTVKRYRVRHRKYGEGTVFAGARLLVRGVEYLVYFDQEQNRVAQPGIILQSKNGIDYERGNRGGSVMYRYVLESELMNAKRCVMSHEI